MKSSYHAAGDLPSFEKATVGGLFWVILNDVGEIEKVCDASGNEIKMNTVKGSRVLHKSESRNELNRLDLSIYVNIANSDDEMKERIES